MPLQPSLAQELMRQSAARARAEMRALRGGSASAVRPTPAAGAEAQGDADAAHPALGSGSDSESDSDCGIRPAVRSRYESVFREIFTRDGDEREESPPPPARRPEPEAVGILSRKRQLAAQRRPS